MADQDQTSRRDLLDRLKIDRSAPEPEGSGAALWSGIGGLALGLIVAGGAAVMLWPGLPTPGETAAPAQTTASAPTSATPAPAQPAVERGGSVLTASGYVTARRLATVSAEITGKVAEILVEEGTPVKAGQMLATLDPTIATLDRDVAAAQRDAAAADKINADSVLARLEAVPRGSVVSEADLIRARSDAKTAAARLAQADAALKRAIALLAKTEIRAPFDGIVTSKDAQPGEIVSPAAAGGGSTRTGICTVVDMTSIEVEVEVSESYISRVSPGQKARATLDAYPDWEIPASVIAIIPTASRDKATVKVRVALDVKDPKILPDMAVKVNFLDAGTAP